MGVLQGTRFHSWKAHCLIHDIRGRRTASNGRHLNTLSRRMGDTSLAERLKQAQRDRVVGKTPFRMPLNAKNKPWRVIQRDRLDQSIRRNGFDSQATGQALDALAMQRVDLENRGQPQALAAVPGCTHHGRSRAQGF